MKQAMTVVLVLALGVALATAEIVDDKGMSPGPANIGNLPDATGGPDDYGYVFADNAEAACSTLFNYVDITASGAPAGLTGVDDDYAGPFPVGFSFDFYGTAYTNFYVGSNGVVYFEDEYLGLGNACPLPATVGYTPQIYIAPYHDDLVVEADGDIYYETFANCPVGSGGQCTVIQFSQLADCCGGDGDDMDFEVVLYANGSVVLLYQQTANDDPAQTNGASATVGLQGSPTSPPTYAIEYSCNTASLTSGLAVAFGHPSAVTGGVPNVCGEQATPTPTGPQPVPTTSNTGLIVLIILVAASALILIGRRTI